MRVKIKSIIAKETDDIKRVMSIIDRGILGTAFIVNHKNKFVGLVTDGDVRRAILKGINLKSQIKNIMNKNPIVTQKNWSQDELNKFLNSEEVIKRIPFHGTMKIPILDDQDFIKDIIFLSSEKRPFIIKHKIDRKDILKKILVIGGAGYIGSVLSRKLLEMGYKVRIYDILLHGDEGIKALYGNPYFELIKGDILNISSMTKAIRDVDAVVHLAAVVGDPAGGIDPEFCIEVNYIATKTIAEICKYYQINRFIFASTCSVYGSGSTNNLVLSENDISIPVSLYGRTKLESEQAILSLTDENFSPTILRFATVYGMSPRMRFDLVVNLLTAKAISEGEISIFGGNQWRPFIHVSDASEAIIKCLESPIEKISGEIFNITSDDQNFSVLDLGNKIKENLPYTKIKLIKEKEDERSYKVSSEKTRKILGFKTKKTLKDGILEIKNAIKSGVIKNYKDKKYSNYETMLNFLTENKN